MIIVGKIKGMFSNSGGAIDDLEERFDKSRKIEKELIDVLMAERKVFKDKIERLEGDYNRIDEQINQQDAVLTNYESQETWQSDVWENLTEDEQQNNHGGIVWSHPNE